MRKDYDLCELCEYKLHNIIKYPLIKIYDSKYFNNSIDYQFNNINNNNKCNNNINNLHDDNHNIPSQDHVKIKLMNIKESIHNDNEIIYNKSIWQRNYKISNEKDDSDISNLEYLSTTNSYHNDICSSIKLPSDCKSKVMNSSVPLLPKLMARFVKDITIPDGTRVYPGTSIIKTWRIRNDGMYIILYVYQYINI
jgi:hypothetical protein